MNIQHLFSGIKSLRDHEAGRVQKIMDSIRVEGIAGVGPKVFEQCASHRWAVQAYDDVLKHRDYIQDIAGLEALYEGMSRDMITFAAQYNPTVSEPPAYWRAYGRAHQEISVKLSRLKVAA